MKRNSSILKKASSFGSITGLSRVLGLIREIIFAHTFGTSIFADAFVTAFVFPNLFRKLFGEGALSGSFIPIFSEHYEKDKKSGWTLLNTILTLLAIILFVLTVIVLLALTAFGRSASSERILYIIELSRIMFPYVIFVCLVGFLFGIFNYFGHYALPALSSVILNIILIGGMILSVFFFSDSHPRIVMLAWLVLFSGMAQCLFYVPLVRRLRIPLKPQLSLKHPGMKQFTHLYIPSVFAISILQINVFTDKIIAVMAGPGAPSVLNFANRVYQLPLGVFAVGIALAALPEFSKAISQKDMKALHDKLSYSLKLSLFIALPSMIGLIILSRPIIAVLFERGEFTQADTLKTARVLSCYAVGLIAFFNLKILTYAFYALKDSITPTKIAFGCMLMNIVLSITLMLLMKDVAGIAVATSIAVGVNIIFLLRALGKRTGENLTKFFMQNTGRYLLPSLGMGIIVAVSYHATMVYMNKYFSLILAIVLGTGIYLGLSFIFLRKDLKIFLGR